MGSDIAGGYPTTERSYRRLPQKGSFVSRFSGDGRTLLYSTLLHKPSGVLVLRMKAVSVGPHAVVVAGSTLLPDHPTTPGAFDRLFGSNGTGDGFHTYDGFVAKLTLDPAGGTDTAAAAPTLVAPANGATVALNGPLTLDWSDVSDPSGVQLYEVQVSANSDLRPATVVALYLLPRLNRQLRPTLLRLAPGTRIVSHAFDMGDWEPDQQLRVNGNSVYFWVVPASVEGSWRLDGPSGGEVQLRQRHQQVRGTVARNGTETRIREARLEGRRLTIVLDGPDRRTLVGEADGESLELRDTADGSRLIARRVAGSEPEARVR